MSCFLLHFLKIYLYFSHSLFEDANLIFHQIDYIACMYENSSSGTEPPRLGSIWNENINEQGVKTKNLLLIKLFLFIYYLFDFDVFLWTEEPTFLYLFEK